MVFQPKSLRVFCAALGLYNVLGAQGHWLGPMAEPGDLARRGVPSCSSGYVACGNSGCVNKSQCCNQDTGWYCPDGNACYTVTGTVDCYSAGYIVPSTARSCRDYAQASCAVGDGCFRCVYTDAPYCYTEVLYGTSEIWIDCTSSASLTITVGYQVSTTVATTPTNSGSGSIGPTSYLRGGSAESSGPSSTITPGPNVSSGSNSDFSTSSSSSSGSHSGIAVGAIVGIAIGAIAVIAIIGALAFLLWKKSQNKPQGQHQQQPQMDTAQYQPPLTPAPGLPQYQPVSGQPVRLDNGYQDPPKDSYYPPQSPFSGQPGGAYGQSGGVYGQPGGVYGQAGGVYGQAGGMHPHAGMPGSSEVHKQGGPAELS